MKLAVLHGLHFIYLAFALRNSVSQAMTFQSPWLTFGRRFVVWLIIVEGICSLFGSVGLRSR